MPTRKNPVTKSECPFEITWIQLPPNAPTHALSIKADVDGHSGERCFIVRVPGYVMKLYPKPGVVSKSPSSGRNPAK
jgi:hypothetical protein